MPIKIGFTSTSTLIKVIEPILFFDSNTKIMILTKTTVLHQAMLGLSM